MTAEDVTELNDLFKDYFIEKKTPSMKDIKKILSISRKNKGHLWTHDARKVQKRLSAAINKSKCIRAESDD
jgi:hypothetical protein